MGGAGCGCGGASGLSTNGTGMISYVYAIGRVEARFPNLSAEKEFAQAAGRADTAGKTDQQTFHTVLCKRENRYLLRQLCWVLSIQGLETYLLAPRDPADIDLLVEAIRPAPSPNDIDVVHRPARPHRPAGDVQRTDGSHRRIRPDLLVRPRRAHQGHPEAGEDRGRAVRAGSRRTVQPDHATDGQRRRDRRAPRLELPGHALSCHLWQGSEEFAHDFSLTGVEVRPSPLSSTRNIVDVIFSYTNRNTDFTEKFFVRADVTEEFPFLVAKMSPYYDR